MTDQALFEFRFSAADLRAVEAAVRGIKNGVPRVLVRALNSTATKTRNESVKEARSDVRLTAKFLKARIQGPADKPNNKATFNRLQSRVTASKRGLRLAHFLSGKQPGEGRPKKPPKVKVKPSGSAKKIAGGFLLRLKNTAKEGENAKLGVFVREGKKIKHLYGPSPSQIFQQELPGLSVAMSKHLIEQAEKETQAVLRQYGGA